MDPRPSGAPVCWGRQYQEDDKECNRCDYRMSCKSSQFRSTTVPHPNALPMYQPQPYQAPQPYWAGQPANHLVPQQPIRVGVTQPQPPQVFSGASFPPPPPTMMTAPPAMALPVAQQQTQHHIPAIQQGAFQQSQYFNQYYSPYPNETVGERLVKHIFLRLGQVFFHELSNFFGLWRWPPGVEEQPPRKQ